MDGMLSAAILLLVFVLVAAACGGSIAWLCRAASASSDYSRSPREGGEAVPAEASVPEPGDPADPIGPVPDTVVDAPAPRATVEHLEGHMLALPAGAEPRELEAPPAIASLEPPETPAEPNAAAEPPGDGAASDGGRIYVLGSSRRSSR